MRLLTTQILIGLLFSFPFFTSAQTHSVTPSFQLSYLSGLQTSEDKNKSSSPFSGNEKRTEGKKKRTGLVQGSGSGAKEKPEANRYGIPAKTNTLSVSGIPGEKYSAGNPLYFSHHKKSTLLSIRSVVIRR